MIQPNPNHNDHPHAMDKYIATAAKHHFHVRTTALIAGSH